MIDIHPNFVSLLAPDEEFLRTDLVSIEFAPSRITVSVESELDSYNPVVGSTWRMTFHRPKKYQFQKSQTTGFELTGRHPLLLPFNEPQSELYFNGEPRCEATLLADITSCHRKLVSDWFTISEFVNQFPYSPKKLQFGLFAKGPDCLMLAYADALNAHGVETSIINRHDPLIWDGEKFEAAGIDNSVLFIGDSYVVSNDFLIQPL
jgi:hypothetical protein